MKKYLSQSEKDTKDIAGKIAKQSLSNVIALSGELGTGKTTFVQGFAHGLGIKEKIISPTFVLIRHHKIPKSDKTLYHIDLYRLVKDSPIKGLGLEEIISNPNNLVLIEWAEKVKDLLPKNAIYITFRALGENRREIILS